MKIIRHKISILSISRYWHLIGAFRVAKAIFKVKLTVHVQQHSFPTQGRMFLWKCQSFWDRKCLDLRGTRTPTFGFIPNALTTWAFALQCCFFITGSGSTNIWEVKLTFEMLTGRGQQHSFSTQKRMFLWKYRNFLCIKCLDLRETRTSNLRIHAECSNHLSCQGHTFAVPCFF